MDAMSDPVAAAKVESHPGFWGELAWFFSGAVLPIGSLWFYRKASQRRVGLAVLFFFVFTATIAVLTTVNVGIAMAGVVREIRSAYRQGNVPDITIRGGVAEVSGPQPFILANERSSSGAILMAVDTTGQISSIDQSHYTQGILMTRTELHVLNPNQGYQRVPLSELNAIFGRDPLVINEETVSNAWATFTAISTAVVFIALVLWDSLVRLMIVATLALIFWGIGSLFRPKVGFGPFIITGLYAVVPAVYISHLFSRSNASFFGLQTILLILFWAAGLYASFSSDRFFTTEVPPHMWTAWLGVPMLLWFIVDMFARFPSPGIQISLWAVALLTILVLAGLRLYFHLQALRVSAAASVPQEPDAPTGLGS